jgi:hypothetical protein
MTTIFMPTGSLHARFVQLLAFLGLADAKVGRAAPRHRSAWLPKPMTMEGRMRWCLSEPTLGELLSDPMVRVLMAADRVPPDKLEADLSEMADAQQQHRARPHPKAARLSQEEAARAAYDSVGRRETSSAG